MVRQPLTMGAYEKELPQRHTDEHRYDENGDRTYPCPSVCICGYNASVVCLTGRGGIVMDGMRELHSVHGTSTIRSCPRRNAARRMRMARRSQVAALRPLRSCSNDRSSYPPSRHCRGSLCVLYASIPIYFAS